MTDRVDAFIVVLEEDIREDEVRPVLDAIRQLRGVLSVEVHIAYPSTAIATARARHEYASKLWDIIHEKE
jgi:hypothetical protein